MSQVFAGDGVMNNTQVNLVTTAETPAITSNFVNPPFQNAKAVVTVSANVNAGTAATALQFKLRRNPNAENLVIGNTVSAAVTVGVNAMYSVQVADAIPDGRPVQYQLTVQQLGATGNGAIFTSCISVFLISG